MLLLTCVHNRGNVEVGGGGAGRMGKEKKRIGQGRPEGKQGKSHNGQLQPLSMKLSGTELKGKMNLEVSSRRILGPNLYDAKGRSSGDSEGKGFKLERSPRKRWIWAFISSHKKPISDESTKGYNRV